MPTYYKDFTAAYLSICKELLLHPQFVSSPRDRKTHEIIDYSFVLEGLPEIHWEQTGMPERTARYESYWQKELAWYLSGQLSAESAPAAFWATIADDNEMITSNYGFMTLHDDKYEDHEGEGITGYNRVVKILKKDHDSRQAMLHYGDPTNFWEGNKDTPCCVSNQFLIRDGKLIMIVNMRSTDVWLGLQFDVRWFSFLQMKLAADLGIEAGEIRYHMGSLHLYEADFPKIEQMLRGYHP